MHEKEWLEPYGAIIYLEWKPTWYWEKSSKIRPYLIHEKVSIGARKQRRCRKDRKNSSWRAEGCK